MFKLEKSKQGPLLLRIGDRGHVQRGGLFHDAGFHQGLDSFQYFEDGVPPRRNGLVLFRDLCDVANDVCTETQTQLLRQPQMIYGLTSFVTAQMTIKTVNRIDRGIYLDHIDVIIKHQIFDLHIEYFQN